jgi:hypothetical protein
LKFPHRSRQRFTAKVLPHIAGRTTWHVASQPSEAEMPESKKSIIGIFHIGNFI